MRCWTERGRNAAVPVSEKLFLLQPSTANNVQQLLLATISDATCAVRCRLPALNATEGMNAARFIFFHLRDTLNC